VLAEYNPLTEREAPKKTAKEASPDAEPPAPRPETKAATPGPAARHKHAPQLAPNAPARPRTAPKGAQ
jgi:hypothetical protein